MGRNRLNLLAALAQVVDERTAKSKTWPDSSRAVGGRMRRAANFLRKIGIEVDFKREGHLRNRVIKITTTQARAAPEHAGAQSSAPSAPPASMPKSSAANRFAAQPLRTVAHNADDDANRNAPIVRAKSLKSKAGTHADDADANRPNQSAPDKTRTRWRARV